MKKINCTPRSTFIAAMALVTVFTGQAQTMPTSTSNNNVHHVAPDSITKVEHFQDHIALHFDNGCVMVGKVMPSTSPTRYRYKGKVCQGGSAIQVPELPFVIPPQFRKIQ